MACRPAAGKDVPPSTQSTLCRVCEQTQEQRRPDRPPGRESDHPEDKHQGTAGRSKGCRAGILGHGVGDRSQRQTGRRLILRRSARSAVHRRRHKASEQPPCCGLLWQRQLQRHGQRRRRGILRTRLLRGAGRLRLPPVRRRGFLPRAGGQSWLVFALRLRDVQPGHVQQLQQRVGRSPRLPRLPAGQ